VTEVPGPSLVEFADAIQNGNTELLSDLLSKTCLNEENRRQILRVLIRQKYRGIMQDEMRETAEPNDWRNKWGINSRSKARSAKYRELNKLEAQEIERFCPYPPASGSPREYGFLPENKKAMLRQMGKDYDELRETLFTEGSGFWLPSDQKKIQLLEQEESKEVAALLSTEEKEELEMHNDYYSHRLATNLGEVLQSEQELMALYRIHKEARQKEEDLSKIQPVSDADRSRIEQEMERQMCALLGSERVASVERQNDPDKCLADSAAKRLGLGEEACSRLLAMRDQFCNQSQLIAQSLELNIEEKRKALKQLRLQVEAQAQGILGSEAGTAYLERAYWANLLNQGQGFTRRLMGGYQAIALGDDPVR
jgi:hypothetical protein